MESGIHIKQRKFLLAFLICLCFVFFGLNARVSAAVGNGKTGAAEPPDMTGKLMEFSYRYGSYDEGTLKYHIFKNNGKLYLEVQERHYYKRLNMKGEVPDNTLDKIEGIIKKYKIKEWNGFDYATDILDGYSFKINGSYENGKLAAYGYEKYPPNYDAGHKALSAFLDKLANSVSLIEAAGPQDNMGKLIGFSYRFGSYFGGELEYYIFKENGKLYLEGRGYNGAGLDVKEVVPDNTLDKIAGIIEEYGIKKWNGFDESNPGVMDGYSFKINGSYENGKLAAYGYEEYPPNYDAGHKILSAYLEGLANKAHNAYLDELANIPLKQ